MQGLIKDLVQEQRVSWLGVEGMDLELRVISSCGCSLVREVSEGRFRGDLFQVLGVLPVGLGALRGGRGVVGVWGWDFGLGVWGGGGGARGRGERGERGEGGIREGLEERGVG